MDTTEAEKPFEDFKVPQMVAFNNSSHTNATENKHSNEAVQNTDEISSQDSNTTETKSSKVKKLIDVPLPYKEPSWSGIPPNLYSLEIIKNGTFLEMFKLKNSLVVFGRLDVCDIKFEHPSVSRYHAVIQYCSGDASVSQGFYLYDLGSTHGTFLNKEKITPKIYYKLKVGYILKFGGSSRLHIFQGPEEEKKETETPKSSSADEICTWGMSEDADEEDDLTENPFALSTPNEELYLDDPKKTLRGWFEREGYEVEYNVEEKGYKTFCCKIQLPVDTPTGDFMTVETSVSGKKKEAVVACALEACRTLDRLGLLRQSHQESRQPKKKKWEENDYYDSDEDTFLDRTGTIEKKREMRKRIQKKTEAETFESIENKLKAVTSEIEEIKKKLTKTEVGQTESNIEDDSLEAYMSMLSDAKDVTNDKIERRKLKYRLVQAEKEKSHLEKLLEIARPTKLPPALKYPGMIGKKPKSKLPKILPKVEKNVPIPKLSEEEEIEEDSDSEMDSLTKATEASNSSIKRFDSVKVIKATNCAIESSSNSQTIDEPIIPAKVVKIQDSAEQDSSVSSSVMDEDVEKPKPFGLILAKSKRNFEPTFSEHSTKSKSDNSDSDLKEIDLISQKNEGELPSPIKKRKERRKQTESTSDVYMKESSEYSTWVPPAGQTGDGMTHLNSKYGY